MAIHIALAGNPNCGKTTMFNALTGANQYVGNWPGVTVEKKTGKLKDASGEEVNVTDLPGVYSLSPYTLEEVVTRDFILKENPDVIVDLVDATNIERNLYLTTQLIETGIPVVIALNMCDLLKKNGINIDVKALSKKLGCPIIETSALKKTGLKEVIAEAIKVAKSHAAGTVSAIFESSVEDKVSAIEAELPSSIPDAEKRWYAIKVLENDSKVADQLGLSIECEVGSIGGEEDGVVGMGECADPEECKTIADLGVDMLAAGIGNIHGKYPANWKGLSFETLDAIQQKTGIMPLVLHGGTGIPADMIKKAITLGVSKINVNTECQLSFQEATRKYIEAGKDLEGKGFDPRKLLAPGAEAIKATVKEKMELFGSVGKA